jgi:hypothetical protein
VITTTANGTCGNRLDKTLSQIESVGIPDSILDIKTFQPDDEDRVRGCYTSHIAVMRDVVERSRKQPDFRALILEDNLESTQSTQLVETLKVPKHTTHCVLETNSLH